MRTEMIRKFDLTGKKPLSLESGPWRESAATWLKGCVSPVLRSF